MIARQTFIRWLWRIPVCMVALIIGQMLGIALVSALGLELLPQLDSAADAQPFLLAGHQPLDGINILLGI